MERDLKKLVASMTLEEKAGMCSGADFWNTKAVERLGIPSVMMSDGPHGMRKQEGEADHLGLNESVEAVCFPAACATASSFDVDLIRQMGEILGEECQAEDLSMLLGPAVNIKRSPLCGRNFEYFSEDPFLTGVCACAITKGVQENHQVLVCPKHFAVNEQETYRRGNAKKQYDAVDSVITERAARELYLKPFEMLVKKANVRCIMTSFNKINGIFAGGNSDLCNRILREEWGYEGFLVTDWGDMDIVVDGADAVAAGNDVVMPGGPPVINQILNGYREGRVTRGQLETAVHHLLQVIESLKGRNGENGKENI